MTILTIGATGFIGPHLVRHLVEHGHEAVVFHRGETNADLPDAVRHLHGDRNALSDHRDAFERVAPDVVIDVVPYTEAQAQEAVDVFEGLADRLVAVSSSDVYRNYDGWRGVSDHDPDPVPLDEAAPLREHLYPYRGYDGLDFEYVDDYDKILVERVLRNASTASTILRLPAVYGPGNTQHRLAPHLRRMDDDRPAILMDKGQADWRWTHGYVENVAAAIAMAATDERAAGQVYNVGEAETPTEAERVRRLARVVGWEGDIVPVPASDLPEPLQAPGDWRYELATDTRRLRTEFGYEAPVTADEALRRTVEWERARRAEEDAPDPDYEAEDAVLDRRS
jgi:nucleoside-diphosphate-sugar epimerase